MYDIGQMTDIVHLFAYIYELMSSGPILLTYNDGARPTTFNQIQIKESSKMVSVELLRNKSIDPL